MNSKRKITLELPCDVGQMVYVVSNKDDKFNPVVYLSEIERFNYTINYRGRKKLTVRVKNLYDCDERKDVYCGGTFNASSFGNSLLFTLDDVKKRLNGSDFTLYYSIGGFAVGKRLITCANVTNLEKVNDCIAGCSDKKDVIISNYDKTKQLCVGDLAKYFFFTISNGECPPGDRRKNEVCKFHGTCVKCWEDWLSSEYSGEIENVVNRAVK